jgi:hypothetical protein
MQLSSMHFIISALYLLSTASPVPPSHNKKQKTNIISNRGQSSELWIPRGGPATGARVLDGRRQGREFVWMLVHEGFLCMT